MAAIFYIRYKNTQAQEENKKKQQQQNASQTHKSQRRQSTQGRTGAALSSAKSAVNRSLAGMVDGDVEQPTKIEQRRKQQQATADKSRIHQGIHEKEQLEQRQKELEQQKMSEQPTRFEFEDSDLMAEVQNLIVCGYPTELPHQRDFIAEGTDFLNRLSSEQV